MKIRSGQNKKQEGVIVAHYGVAVDVLFSTTGERSMVRVKRNSGHVVGDDVVVRGETLTRLPRNSELSRMDARGGIHIVAANLDVLGIVVTCEPLEPPGFIDRAIVAARALNLTPLLVLNKYDLPCFAKYSEQQSRIYSNSVDIFKVSAESGKGLDKLHDYFAKKHRGVFVGPTGVGKSSVLNTMLPDLNLQTGEISETKKRGRHTTTVSTLHTLEGGGELIDSPGFNDFGLVGITIAELALFFPGFEEATTISCKFRDCKHREEPGCTVTEFVAEKKIDINRYQTYLHILTEVENLQSEPKFRERRHRRKKS